ncbi:DUF4062 domain-containing protein [Fictibacillus sp. Mic-4]|uniref:DUF4062 domain-containing protein n=1 Tax=Fictibacillus sp. Mic-4 TaxID=3132826 RepID=UPI003CF20019
MANPAKIFISSAAQESLSTIRHELFNALETMGHKPLMYEKNFGPWPANQLVEKCLEKVEESDIFILIISYQAGNYSEYYKATVTHLEFQRAYTSGKYTMVFVEDPIYNLFWNELKEQFPDLSLSLKKNMDVTQILTKKLPKRFGSRIRKNK